MLDGEGRVCAEITGWSGHLGDCREPGLGEPFAGALPEADAAAFAEALRLAAGQGRAELELLWPRGGGGSLWVRCRLAPVGADRIGALVEDIDGPRRALEALRGRADRTQSFVDNTADAFIAHDMNGRFVDVNKAMCDSVGYSREELLQMHIYEVELTVKKGSIRGIWSRMTPGIPVTIEGKHRRRDGSVFPVEVRLGLFGEGDAARVMALCRNISERKRAEAARHELNEALALARDEAIRADQAKSQFLANMSHELRTPLNAVIGYTELITEDLEVLGASSLRPDLERVHGAATFLLGLINDILDISKIEAGRFDIYLEELDVEHVIAEVADVIQPLAARNGNRLVSRIEAGIGAVRTDRLKLRQVMNNLLSNACKFTSKGEIELVVRREGSRGEWLVIEVSDTGVGIPPERCEMIFEAFAQADSSTTRKYGGTGLGLTISRRFCEMLGGGIEVKSTVGEGSTFTVRLLAWATEEDVLEASRSLGIEGEEPTAALTPAAERSGSEGAASAETSAEPAQAPTTAAAGEGLELPYDEAPVVLVIDDDPAVHDLIARHLVREGVRIRSAYDGREGIAHARAFRPAAILLDVMLPDISGWEVLAALKAEPTLATIPVVFSSILQEEDRALSLGADDYLVKPVSRERLLSVLTLHAGGGEGTVLVVDDDADAREVYRRGLRQSGWEVREACHGVEALERLEEDGPADVIILDLMMPQMDGFAVVEHLRRDPRWSGIPVVIASAMELSETDRRQLRSRVAAVYRKGSLSLVELSASLARLAKKRNQAEAGSRS